VASLFQPIVPNAQNNNTLWGGLKGPSLALALANASTQHNRPLLVITDDVKGTIDLREELQFFLKDCDREIVVFPDWETLPYDIFSPLPETISERLRVLNRASSLKKGIILCPVSNIIKKISPRSFVEKHSFQLTKGQKLNFHGFLRDIEQAGYRSVSQVVSHGEFATRGSLIDIFPMGSNDPIRIDLFDNDIDSIRVFDADTQLTKSHIDKFSLLPAKEFPLDSESITNFRQSWRSFFPGNPKENLIYRNISENSAPGGIEYYLPLFFKSIDSFFEYLPKNTIVISNESLHADINNQEEFIQKRYEQRKYDIERPILPPEYLYFNQKEINAFIGSFHQVNYQSIKYEQVENFEVNLLLNLTSKENTSEFLGPFKNLIKSKNKKILLVAETSGRRELLIETLNKISIFPKKIDTWSSVLGQQDGLYITIAPFEVGFSIKSPDIIVVPENIIFHRKVKQKKRRAKGADVESIIKTLAELQIDSPVIHEEHGVGRFKGLQTLDANGIVAEYLTLEYAQGDKLYVPVSSLHLVTRYTGASPESAPLHRLGTGQWERARSKAAKKVRDIAVELLDIYSRRESKNGFSFPEPGDEYSQFVNNFEYEETPDQITAIESVINDMTNNKAMDRVICGDVGFGKTEVAMRAAYVAVNAFKQVAVLAPTTLLTQQHFQSFSDRFADLPFKVESLSRFKSQNEINKIKENISEGKIDILIGTHKILVEDLKFKNLGLLIIDEEHRFGVRQKEKLKSFKSEVDILTMTATPIPRTLNMSLSGMRDLSIISTPPAARHPIKTFLCEWSDMQIKEACEREISRGGQIFFLNNDIKSILKISEKLKKLIPNARVAVAHGRMKKNELESIMRDFYHQKFDLLVCTTIIESGIDIPTANTIIINRADKFGLAQLHQLRGRVGRSHHRAYAYLLIPEKNSLSADSMKRLEVIESLEELGAGFTLASHDLEIRGAGELLGEEQSGQIHEVGFTMYIEMLEQTVKALKSGKEPNLDKSIHHGTEIDLQIPALIPEQYIPDVHLRLMQYKKISSIDSFAMLDEVKIEMIDRFGLLPDYLKNLFEIQKIKFSTKSLGLKKIEIGPNGGRIIFKDKPEIDTKRLIQLIRTEPKIYSMDGPNKLKFQMKSDNFPDRLKFTEKLIHILTPVNEDI
tara:strand:+ start:1126 stop:4575 length:3450 start_codon:yes stop_codon:yes gene_type:complete